MDYISELNKSLNELNRVTGLSFQIQPQTDEEAKYALEQLKLLSSAYKEKYNKIHFLQSLMTDSIPSYYIYERASRLHIEPEESRVLYLLETKHGMIETIPEVIKHLFPPQPQSYLIPLTDNTYAILCAKRKVDDVHKTAQMLVDTLNAESLVHVRVAYSKVMDSLIGLSEAFRETSLALKVGKIFYSEQTIFPYNKLGIGRLIYRLPYTLCENFLQEVFGSTIPEVLDEELLVSVNKFFQNNLNIAETSRQLHMHRNTLIYRLDQVQKLTGLDLRKFEDAMTLKIAFMVMNYLNTERKIPNE
ncbi:MAG: helix-turn-helix domain-containing protein [Candidatus Ruminococcus intestinipullorum]|nr:helix-turn-helix domain-containing protein [Candidatus Ruminococcus intestinipullorum]